MDFPARLIACFVAVIMITLFPLQYIAQSQNENIDSLIDEQTKSLSDSIRDKGYLDAFMYEDYIKFLDTTGEMYDIEIEDIHPVAGDEVVIHDCADPDCHDNIFHTTKVSHENSTASKVRLVNNITMNTTKPMAFNPKEIQSFSAHTHTDTCFSGHRHNANCNGYVGNVNAYVKINIYEYSYNSFNILIECKGCNQLIAYYNVNFGGTNPWDVDFIGFTGNAYVNTSDSVRRLSKNYEWKRGYNVTSEEFNTILNQVITLKNYLQSYVPLISSGNPKQWKTNETSIYNKNIPFPYPKFTYYYDYYVPPYYQGCVYCGGPTYTSICGQPQDETPICNYVVTSISPTNPVQYVTKGGNIITTASASFLDGNISIVNCTSNFNPNMLGYQRVTLTYSGLVGNAKTTGTVSCYVDVYVANNKNLVSITASPGEQTISRYEMPSCQVTAYYDDETSTVLSPGQYTMSGFNAATIGLQTVSISYTDNGITKTVTARVQVTLLHKTCPRCGNTYDMNGDDTDPGCPFCRDLVVGIKVVPDVMEVEIGSELPISVHALYNDGTTRPVYGWVSNFNPDKKGLQNITVEYGGYGADITVWVNERSILCPVCGTEYYESEGYCPVCAEKLIQISVSPESITVRQHDNINLEVTAFYADGSSKQVTDWSIDRDTSEKGTFTATVSNQDQSTTISLTVIGVNEVECPICGLFYDPGDNPIGCPVCSITLTGIEAYLTSGANLIQYGTTPSIAVILVFLDTHRELVNEGYHITNFAPFLMGDQTITVTYQEFSTTIDIEVVETLSSITCPNGHVYYRNEDGSDPGCPYCNISDSLSTIYYFDITYTNEMLEAVYTHGKYEFADGNFLIIKLTKKDRSLLTKTQKMFFKTSLFGRKKRMIYGGEVIL